MFIKSHTWCKGHSSGFHIFSLLTLESQDIVPGLREVNRIIGKNIKLRLYEVFNCFCEYFILTRLTRDEISMH